MLLPTTFTIPKVSAPSSFALRIAANVSAVSPDWLTPITRDLLLTAVSLYLNSEAYSTLTGIFNNSSSIDEVLYICQRAELSQCNDTGGKYHFAITWNRFVNIQLEKWVEGTGWVMQ